jgi:hypothetical protein
VDADRQETRRSAAGAAALTIGLLAVEVAVTLAASWFLYAVAGEWAGLIAFFVVEIAILSFVTVRVYPPGAKRHFVVFFVLTLLFSVLVPLAYLNWKWARADFPPPS